MVDDVKNLRFAITKVVGALSRCTLHFLGVRQGMPIKLMPAYYLIKKRTTSSSDAGLPSAVITFIPRVKGVRSIKKGKSPFGATVLSP